MNDLGSSAYRLSDKPDEFVERINLRSGSVKDQMILFLAGVYRELRQVFNEYRLKPVLSPSRYDEQMEAAYQPGYGIDEYIYHA
mgnify:CR=1 FL=1